jgi:hypothetical protein
MRGSFVGLALDSSLADLAFKFNVTLEAIALQTRHIVDTLNAKGHSIQEICISGGQAKNAPLVQLVADVCGIPVVLPGLDSDGGTSVVRGAAMLGRFAAEVTTELSSKRASGASESIGSEDQGVQHAGPGQTRQEPAPVPVLPTQLDVDQESKGFGAARLWNIMVRISVALYCLLAYRITAYRHTAYRIPHTASTSNPILLYFPISHRPMPLPPTPPATISVQPILWRRG